MTLDDLKATLDSLSLVKVSFVTRVIDALTNPPTLDIRSAGTWLTDTPDWTEYFGLALSVHHGASVEPLRLTSFESVFRNACEHMDWPVSPRGSATQRFVDMTVTPSSGITRRLSLKSTAAKKLSKSSIHISKLTEAAWIQDTRKASDRRRETLALFQEYRKAVSHIVMLRAFCGEENEAPYLYQLVEVPVCIFDSIQNAPLEVFEPSGPNVPCTVGDDVVAVVALDRSDAKITARHVKLSACTVHAEWRRQNEGELL